jgi:diadenosine tetraphosphate (Ap4A) HIT family hydrolase
MLVIPKRHHTTIFESTPEEIEAVFELIQKAKELLLKEYKPDGFNIVANCGEAAGQIVMHAHMHLLPRYKGQPVNPLVKKADNKGKDNACLNSLENSQAIRRDQIS